ncbi:MAG: selenoneine biosynthesis selenosugar synthase SenB [Acidobacteriota bacterium]
MNIELITPLINNTTNGNYVTAQRVGSILRQLGHQVTISHRYDSKPCDLLLALHALHSYESIKLFHDRYPNRPLIVMLTGTDLYNYINIASQARRSLELATRLVVLQKRGLLAIPEHLREKTRVIYQSSHTIKRTTLSTEYFQVCVIGNLRQEKDPLRTALAVRKLPASSRVRVIHVGQALNDEMEKSILAEIADNPRYQWVGPLTHQETKKVLAASHLVSITSRMEGSSNVLCEALAASLPVIASYIPGLIGTLGEDYPGYFPVGDTDSLTKLIDRTETDASFYQKLQQHCAQLSFLVDPDNERRCWQQLLAEIA